MFIRRFPEPIPAGTQRPLWACLPIGVCILFCRSPQPSQYNFLSQTIFGIKLLHKLKLLDVSTFIGVLTERF